MADSQPDSKVFSVRIVSIDHYMAPPMPGVDICYSSFQGEKVHEVPVIRVYGSTPAGQKTCLHLHGALPYLYVPYGDIPLQPHEQGEAGAHAISLALEKSLKLKSNAGSKRQHIHGCSLVRAKKFYGYHSSEELFVKINLYHPHDISRAANLLLGGAVLDKSLQPHESHIPFILQFLIDYNLYGMGHLHTSKVKFRSPVPDYFTLNKFQSSSQHEREMVKLTKTSADFQADPSGSSGLNSQLWLSSTIPGDWKWEFSSGTDGSLSQEFNSFKRQSVCELEGDSIIDDIVNQHFKMYTSLSQARSDVKMVQSLIPIWEEEYERTGIQDTALPLNPGKPLPQDVLKTFSLGLEFGNALTKLCEGEEIVSSLGNDVMETVTCSSGEENLVELGLVRSDDIDAENLSYKKERSTNESQLDLAIQEKMDATPSEGKDGHINLLSDNEIKPSEPVGTINSKASDKEALRLLKWLATSQAAEELNSDDELLRETILSPLLPTTIDKVLEKANVEYEYESQKECQDILDSVDNLINFDGLEETTSCSVDRPSNPLTSSEKRIPQVDGYSDDSQLSPHSETAKSSSKVEMKSKFKRSSQHQVPSSSGSSITGKHNTERTLWGSLPFSWTGKGDNDAESISLNIPNACVSETKDCGGNSSLAANELRNCSDACACDTKEPATLFTCSVRDLMRRKRCHRVESPELESHRVKRILSKRKQKEDSSRKEDYAPFVDRCEAYSGKEYNSNLRATEANSDVLTSIDSPVERECISLAGVIETSGLENRSSTERVRDMSNGKLDGADTKNDSVALQNEKPVDYSGSLILNMGAKPMDLIGMTFCQKPPAAECKVGDFEHVFCSSAKHEHPFLREELDYGTLGRALHDAPPFFEQDWLEGKEDHPCGIQNSDSKFDREAFLGVPTLHLNDGSCLYVLAPALSPPSVDCVSRWLLNDNSEGASADTHRAGEEPSFLKGSPDTTDSLQRFLHDDCAKSFTECGSNAGPKLEEVCQKTDGVHNAELVPQAGGMTATLQGEQHTIGGSTFNDCVQDASQISGPDGRSRATPLSQIGFRDPASIGAGEQLTLLSIEVQAESRGDLRPDPRYDAVNVVALAFQNDNDSVVEVYVLLRTDVGSNQRNLDGISNCNVLVFSEEKHLFSHFIKILSSFDPDILMGWDIQGGSLGFLAERAAHLGIGLLNNISRTPSGPKIAAGDLEVSEKETPDNLLRESVLEDAVIEDEWGRTHASGVHVGGRIVLNVWRLMRGEVKLNFYTIEAVAEAVLRRKTPSISYKVLTRWFSSGSGQARYRCIEYVLGRAKLNLEIMNKLDMINRTSELARVFGIDFFSVLSRGSQYRVESMFLRLAHTQNYLAISPGNQQVASQPAMECLPLVMEPESGFYADPVVVLDFQSLYPSMIIAYNLCFCTCLGKVVPSKENVLGVSSFSPDLHVLQDLKNQILLTPNGVMYVPSEVRKGVLPRLLEEILSTRIMVKQAMKKLAPSQQVLHRIFNARQLALKLIANVTYGYTAAGFSGRMPCAELADSIVQCGRCTLEHAISLVNANEKWNAQVVYGDTDSMFVRLKGRTVKDAFQIGYEIASAITAINPYPVTLKMEKVYYPCFLLTKKRYVGYSYESPDQIEPTFDAKGIETVRRDTCSAVAKIMEQSLRLFFASQDIFQVKAYLQRQWTRILSGRVSIQDFVFAKEVRLGTYSTRTSSSLPPAAIVATKSMRVDPRAEPRYGERVPYIVIHGEPGARLVDMVVDPLDLLAIDSPYRLNDLYYINKQIIPVLQRVFGLVGADLTSWFLEMPRPAREAIAKRPLFASNPQRSRIDYYYLSRHCIVCSELVQASAHLCKKCSQNDSIAVTVLTGRTSKLEGELQHLAAICRHCGGGDWIVESGVKCTSLACSVFYERRKVQKELQGLSTVASEKGFYPKCMVEWF